jgi:cytoskeletal protein CcmA (bactofilin family)
MADSGAAPNAYRLGPNGRVKAKVNACAVVVQGRLEGNIQSERPVEIKQSTPVVRATSRPSASPVMKALT